MSVDAATVRRIAHLARIAVTEAEVPHLQGELNAMLAFVEAFFVMGVVFLLMLPFLPLLQYSKAKRPRAGVVEAEKEVPALDGSAEGDEEQVPETYDEEHHLVMH